MFNIRLKPALKPGSKPLGEEEKAAKAEERASRLEPKKRRARSGSKAKKWGEK
jgi:hypothetical protein